MRGVLVVLCSGGIAAADPYPTELVDRPLVVPDGTTALDVSVDVRTAVRDGTRTGITDNVDPDINVSHAFGSVVAGLGIAHDAYAFVDVDLGGPELALGGSFSAPQSDDSYSYQQHAGVSDKVIVVPGSFAVFGSATAYLYELRGPNPMPVSGHVFAAAPRAGVELQIDPHWALAAATDLFIPIQQSSGLTPRIALDAYAEALVAIGRWDIYLNGTLYDVTRTGPSTLVELGFVKRWF